MRTSLCMALALLLSVACGDDEEPEAAQGGAATAGGEAPAQVNETMRDMEQPPGSVQPPDPGQAAAPAPAAGTPAAPAQPEKPKKSPWGSTVANQGRKLPTRRPMSPGAQRKYQAAASAAAAGNFGNAKRDFEAAVKADPRAYQALYGLGVIADRQGKETKALDYYGKSLSVQADYEKAAQGKVAIYLRRGQGDRALNFMKPLAEKWERNLYLQAVYADLLTQMGRPGDAVDVARKALRRDEKFVPAMVSLIRANLRQGKTELADSITEQALKVEPNNAELHYIKGQRALEEKRLAVALQEFRKAVQLRPDYAEARMALGIRLLAGANYNEALEQFKAVEKLSPKLVEVHLALGDAYRATKQWTTATKAFEKALRMERNLPEAHFNMALMYFKAGADFPGLDYLGALAKAREEFGAYRSMKGSKLGRDDPSAQYLEDIDKAEAREKKRIEREKKRKEREAKRAARKKAQEAKGGDQ